MARTLMHLAQSALGVAPAVMPVARPLFAAQPTPNMAAEGMNDQPEATRATTSAEGSTTLQPSRPRVPEMHRSHPELETASTPRRAAAMQESATANRPSLTVPVVTERPTLRQVLDQMFPPASPETRVSATATVAPLAATSEELSREAKSRAGLLREGRSSVREGRSSDGYLGEGRQQEMPKRSAQTSAPIATKQETARTAEASPLVRTSRPTMPQETPARPSLSGKENQRTGPARPMEQPALPEVRVTIGSIEIKATPQSAPVAPARVARMPAHMTISEYLNQRRSKRL